MLKPGILTKNILWNTVGNIFYLGCLWLLSVFVVRLSHSYVDAGILSLSMSVTNIFSMLALFSIRNYQVSDLEDKYSQADYIAHRLITCSAAFVLCIVFVLLNGYSAAITLSITAYMLFKAIESLADVFHGILQRKWRFELIGRSYIYRGFTLLITFTLIYKLFGQLWIALLSMAVLTTLVFTLYDWRQVCRFTEISFRTSWEKIVNLTRDCLPLMLYSLLLASITSTARFFIERYHGEEALGYYGSIATIAVIVQSTVSLIFTPLNGLLSDSYARGDHRAIVRLSARVLLLLTAVTGVAMLAARLLGRFVLVLLFGEDIAPYVWLLYPTILASCLTGLVWYLAMLLTIMRSMKSLVIGATAGFTVCLALSLTVIPQSACHGANLATIVALVVLSAVYAVAAHRKIRPNRGP